MIQMGKQSLLFPEAVYVENTASVVGKKEGEGPLKDTFDLIVEDGAFGEDSWEAGESEMIQQTMNILMRKANIMEKDVRYLFAGDLLGQLIATTFAVKNYQIPLFGLYGACSTVGEALSLGAMTVAAGYADRVMALASSHYASAEKQFRYPLEYGNQRPLSATWTVVGCGAFLLSNKIGPVAITGITTGKIVDYGIKDSMNMGAAMAPAAADLIYQHFKDFNCEPEMYDKIITGDLGLVGQKILWKLLDDNGYDISSRHMDCGIEIYDIEAQDVHSGGSGCGCSAVTLAGYIYDQIRLGIWKRVLFLPTGALLSTVSFNEGQTVPGISHGIIIEHKE